MNEKMEQSSGHEADSGHERVSVVTPRNAPVEPATGPVPSVVEADGGAGRAAAERSAATAQASQAGLTQSVGTRLTRDGHDSELPSWRRWLTKTFNR